MVWMVPAGLKQRQERAGTRAIQHDIIGECVCVCV